MSSPESSLPIRWFVQGDQDLEAAEILLQQAGPLPVVAFHLQQVVEKYLKGFLLSTGWSLRRIHDLELLVQEAIARDDDFSAFLTPCQRITEYYIETRYPLGLPTSFDPPQLERDLEAVRDLIALIKTKVDT